MSRLDSPGRLGRRSVLMLAVGATTALAACGNDGADAPAPPPPTQVTAVDTPRPDYPIEMACAGIGGTVTLSISVGTDGRPADVRLVQGSGTDALDSAAMEGVRNWQFNPATRNGQPVPQSIQVPVNYRAPQVRPDACFALDSKR